MDGHLQLTLPSEGGSSRQLPPYSHGYFSNNIHTIMHDDGRPFSSLSLCHYSPLAFVLPFSFFPLTPPSRCAGPAEATIRKRDDRAFNHASSAGVERPPNPTQSACTLLLAPTPSLEIFRSVSMSLESVTLLMTGKSNRPLFFFLFFFSLF